MNNVWIGTSGWTYDGWRGPFYPKDVAKKKPSVGAGTEAIGVSGSLPGAGWPAAFRD